MYLGGVRYNYFRGSEKKKEIKQGKKKNDLGTSDLQIGVEQRAFRYGDGTSSTNVSKSTGTRERKSMYGVYGVGSVYIGIIHHHLGLYSNT